MHASRASYSVGMDMNDENTDPSDGATVQQSPTGKEILHMCSGTCVKFAS